MSVAKFYDELKDAELTTEMLAALIGSERSHLCRVFNNEPGRGGNTRKKLVKLVWTAPHPKAGQKIFTPVMLAALGWSSTGKIVPRGVCQFSQNRENAKAAAINPAASS